MNKRGLIKYILIVISSFISLYFLITSELGFGFLPLLLLFILSLTIFMFVYRNKIKKYKSIYNVILMLMMAFFLTCLGFYLYSTISCYFDISCYVEDTMTPVLIYSMLLFLMLLFNFKDIFNNTNKLNDILTIIICSTIILIYIRYYFDGSFMHKIVKSEYYKQTSYLYITQNYIYFNILYIVNLLHKLVNNKTMNQS